MNKKSERQKLIDKIWANVSRLIRIRDGWTCQNCGEIRGHIGAKGKTIAQGLDAAHAIGKGKSLFLRFNPQNLFSLCSMKCHKIGGWHAAEIDLHGWFARKWPERYKYIMYWREIKVHWRASEIDNLIGFTKALVRSVEEFGGDINMACEVLQAKLEEMKI